MLPFTVAEYKDRLAKVKEKMVEREIEVLILAEPANMNYLAGYDALSFYTPQVVIVMLDEEQPLWVGRYQDLHCARETTWLAEPNIIAYPDHYLWEPAEKHVMDFVAGVLKEKGAAGKKIGVEMDAYYYTAHWHQRLLHHLPQASFLDASRMVNWIRGVKSRQELEYMRRAARITEAAMHKAYEKIAAGVRECDVAAEIYRILIGGREEFGGDYPSLAPIMPSGDRTAGAHLTWTDNCYRDNQIVYMEFSGCHKRYHAPLARTFYIGKPPEKIHDTVKVVIEGLHSALEAARPGATCEQVERAWQQTINKYGLEKESRMGYAIGLSYPPVWAEDTSYFRPGDKTVLQPNMTYHFMPGMWVGEFGIAITESVVITDKGSETLTKFPQKLLIKE